MQIVLLLYSKKNLLNSIRFHSYLYRKNVTQLSLESLVEENNWKLFFVSAMFCLSEFLL